MTAVTVLGCGSGDSGMAALPLTEGDARAHTSAADGGTSSPTNGADCKAAPPETLLRPGNLCESRTVALASRDTQSPLGFSASDVLILAGHGYSVPLSWETDELGPEAPSDSLQIVIAARDSIPRYLESTPDPTVTGFTPSCSSTVEVDVRVQLTSAGGALNETLDTVLHAEAADMASVQTLLVPSLNLRGQLALTPAMCRTALRFSGLEIALDFSTSGMSGHIGAQLTDGDAVQTVTLARFSSQP
jgi:hypothetical protein